MEEEYSKKRDQDKDPAPFKIQYPMKNRLRLFINQARVFKREARADMGRVSPFYLYKQRRYVEFCVIFKIYFL